MSLEENTCSNARYAEAAARAGYTYEQADTIGPRDGQPELFKGSLSFESFSSGVTVCFSDLTSIVDSEHDGLMDRSWTVAMNLGAVPTTTQFGRRNEFDVSPDKATIVAFSDQTRMANRIRAGEKATSLLLSLKPSNLTDDVLAEDIHLATMGTAINQIDLTPRLRFLAHRLASPALPGAPGRLLAESQALELLAHILLQCDGNSRREQNDVSDRDRLALMRVRGAIHAHPSYPFTLQGLASEACMSISSLKAKFPRVFGETVFSYIRGVRLDHARDRIVEDGWAVSQAAHFVGYRHHGNFTKAFHRRFGIRPVDLIR
mgnify:CR=1 FL=1